MTSFSAKLNMSKFRISRRGRKLQSYDDHRTILALPKDVPERTWVEILLKEETDLMIFDIREEILEEAMRLCYESYMEKQNSLFTAHCAAEAWLKLIDWHFYRHDPGEDPSSYPPCYIPRRVESWVPDKMPDPSPKDTWARQELLVVEESTDEPLPQVLSSTSLEFPVVETIPQECWFPGKVILLRAGESQEVDSISYSGSDSQVIVAPSEVLQRVTDYTSDDIAEDTSSATAPKTLPSLEGSLQGAGDSTVVDRPISKRELTDRSKLFRGSSVLGRSRVSLPPLDLGDSVSRISVISDCRLRNLRLETQYEITSERMDTPPGEQNKRK